MTGDQDAPMSQPGDRPLPPPHPGDPASWWRDGLPLLEGTRITLREPEPADAATLVEALANPAVRRFMSPPPDTPSGFHRFIAWVRSERSAGRCFCFAMVPHGTQDPAGLIQFRAVEPGFSTAEWGFALCPSHWGTGLFMDAARIVVDFAFRSVGVHRLEARASVVNGRGNGALRKLGAVPEGVLKESLLQDAEHVDQILWAMLEEDWLRQAAAPAYRITRHAPPSRGPGPVAPLARAARPAWCEHLPMLRGPTCVVREIEEADVHDLHAMLADPEVRRYASTPPLTPEGFSRFVEWSRQQQQAGRFVCFAIESSLRAGAAGIIQLRALEPSFGTAEWGFAIGRPHWGTGLFSAAASLVLDFAFDTIGVHRLEARSVMDNSQAIRALRRLGSVLEGTLRRSFLLGGHYHDDALFALLADDWQRRRALRQAIA
jgi:RimJ/RimL family protein N-acetyltransferase